MKTTDFSKYLSDYLIQYLPNECGVAHNTIQTYSVTFMILLRFFREEEALPPDRLSLKDLTKKNIISFLDWLQTERKSSDSTRNARLATLHSFFRYLQYRDVKGIQVWQDILSIRFKKSASPDMAYLTVEGMQLLLSQPDTSTKIGRRDLALLGLLYDSAARVQELADLTVADIRFEGTTTIRLKGKGQKSRIVPLNEVQVRNLKSFMEENHLFESHKTSYPLFANPQNNKLSRMAIFKLVKKYASAARSKNLTYIPNDIGCHSLRHSKAIHMLEAGINLVYIRDFLGHASTTTTEIYARASTKMKEDALKKIDPSIVPKGDMSWQKNGVLLNWLKELQK